MTAPIPDYAPEPEREWIFTFGHGQRGYSHGRYDRPQDLLGAGFRLDDRYVRITGTYDSARARMVEIFGPVWSMQYRSTVEAGVELYGLVELVITADWQPDTPTAISSSSAEPWTR